MLPHRSCLGTILWWLGRHHLPGPHIWVWWGQRPSLTPINLLEFSRRVFKVLLEDPSVNKLVSSETYRSFDIFTITIYFGPFRRIPFSYGNILFQILFSKRHRLFSSWTKSISSKVRSPCATYLALSYLFNSFVQASFRLEFDLVTMWSPMESARIITSRLLAVRLWNTSKSDLPLINSHSDLRKKFG